MYGSGLRFFRDWGIGVWIYQGVKTGFEAVDVGVRDQCAWLFVQGALGRVSGFRVWVGGVQGLREGVRGCISWFRLQYSGSLLCAGILR